MPSIRLTSLAQQSHLLELGLRGEVLGDVRNHLAQVSVVDGVAVDEPQPVLSHLQKRRLSHTVTGVRQYQYARSDSEANKKDVLHSSFRSRCE